MKIYQTLMLGCAMVAPALLVAGTAQAQVGGIAVADPESAIMSAKAWAAANQSIGTTYKAQLDQAATREQALQTEINTIGAPLDLNKDKNIDDAEIAAAQKANNPALAKLEAAQKAGQADLARLRQPAILAQLYAIEQISTKYGPALKAVIDSKKLSLVLTAQSAIYATDAVDITDDVKNQIDLAAPTVPTTPPAGWQPSQQAVQLLQQYNQAVQIQQMRAARAAQSGAAPTATAGKPAAGKQPAGR
jgi:Skp family chaperone for outer membrane proteins